MKTRNGFVSNSSSSSFIIGYFEVINKSSLCKNEKFNITELTKTHLERIDSGDFGANEYFHTLNCCIASGKIILEHYNEQNPLIIRSFNEYIEVNLNKIDINKDYFFINSEGSDCYDEDIDLEYFRNDRYTKHFVDEIDKSYKTIELKYGVGWR